MPEVTASTRERTTAWPNSPGSQVTQYELTAGDLTVMLTDLGARVVSVSMPDASGTTGPVSLSMPSVADYEDTTRNMYLGDTVGRYANRIAGARFTLDATEYRLNANDGPNHLHGGPGGLGRRLWSGEPFTEADAVGVRFSYVSPHNEEGYPGELHVTSTTVVRTDGTITFVFVATTDRPTVVSLTNHTYWNLGGVGTIDDHLITLAAERYLPVDATGIPTVDAPAPVAGTTLDLRMRQRLGDVIAERRAAGGRGIDHCYLPDSTAGIDEPQAVVSHPASGRRLELWSDQPGLQCYTGHHLTAPDFAPYAGFCLEPQHLPDAPNRPAFPSPVLRPDETYRATTVVRLSVVETMPE